METEQGRNHEQKDHQNRKTFLVVLNCILLSVGEVGGPLLQRVYFLHGGKRKWLCSWLLTSGFPILILPIAISYAQARSRDGNSTLLVTPWLFAASAFLGCLLGLDSYLMSFGLLYLPISVSGLLCSLQLVFVALFAFLVAKHKFTHYSINAVVLMTFGSIILGIHMDADRPRGEPEGKYILGYFMTIAAAALHGFIMSALEYAQMKSGLPITFVLVMQVQLLMSVFATIFCTVPMIINKDFQAISKEAAEFDLGPNKYYTIVVLAAVAMQLLTMGLVGVTFCSSSLFGGLVASLLVPVQQVFAVIFLRESFSVEKGMTLAMCLWGFASHLFGEYNLKYKKPAAAKDSNEELT